MVGDVSSRSGVSVELQAVTDAAVMRKASPTLACNWPRRPIEPPYQIAAHPIIEMTISGGV